MHYQPRVFVLASCFALMLGCDSQTSSSASQNVQTLTVTASAYNSIGAQTDEHPALAAWGDELRPGMKAIAVSRDLLAQGLTYQTSVTIEGLEGEYLVLDKMNKRWKNKIDIYMGENTQAAKTWGVRQVTIRWVADEDESAN